MSEQQETTKRIFKIGTTRIVEDETMQHLDQEEVRALLKNTYPEVTHATIREQTLEDGTIILNFLPQAGRKG